MDRLTREVDRLVWKNLPGPVARPNQAREHADLLREGVVTLHGGKRFPIATNWGRDELGALSRVEQRSLHMHAFIGDCILASEQTKDKAYIDLAFQKVEEWKNNFRLPEDEGTMAFHEETAGRRAAYWLKLYLALKMAGDREKADFLKEALVEYIRTTLRQPLDADTSTQGMTRLLTLLYGASVLDIDVLGAGELLAHLENHFLNSVTADGVHKEHSPSYHFLSARNIFINLPLITYLDREKGERLAKLLGRMSRFALNIVDPNHCYPKIGDTEALKIPANYMSTFNLDNSATSVEKSAKFYDGGYAILRDDPARGVEQTYILLTASYHTNYHKHEDDLSLMVYSDGWVVGESGPFGYNYTDPMCKHGYSSASHSTLVVKGVAPIRNPGLVFLTGGSDASGVTIVNGVNYRYPGIAHERSIEYNRNEQLLTVNDAVTGKEPFESAILWQLSPGIEPMLVGGECHLLRSGVKAAKINVESKGRVDLELTRGMANGEYPAFDFPKMGQKQETGLLVVKAAQAGRFDAVTSLTLFPKAPEGERRCELSRDGWPVQYVVSEKPESRKLVVVFPSEAKRFNYPIFYKAFLNRLDENLLFLVDDFGPAGSYLICHKGEFGLARSVAEVIEKARERLNVSERDVYLVGTGRGGATAIYMAGPLGYGNVVAGSPHIYLGRQLSGNVSRASTNVKEFMLPEGAGPDWLDTVITSSRLSAKVTMRFYTSDEDPNHVGHLLPYLDTLKSGDVSVEVEVAGYKDTTGLTKGFIDYAGRIVRGSGGSTPTRPGGGANGGLGGAGTEGKGPASEEKPATPRSEDISEGEKAAGHDFDSMSISFTVAVDGDNDQITAEISQVEGCEYAFYVQKNGVIVKKFFYGTSNRLTYDLANQKGVYHVMGFIRNAHGNVRTLRAAPVYAFGRPVEKEKIGEEIADLEHSGFHGEGPIYVKMGRFAFHCLFSRNEKHSDRLFVLLSAAVRSNTAKKAVFNRWNWRKRFPGNVICIADPTIYENQGLLVGWYLGSEEQDATNELAELIRRVAENLKVENRNVVTYGSSAAGFASLALGLRMDDTLSVAINPQTIVTEYIDSAVNNLRKKLFDDETKENILEKHTYRLSIPHSYKEHKSGRTLIVQNKMDNHHWRKHFNVLCDAIDLPIEGGVNEDGTKRTLVYSHESGHAAEPDEVFTEIIDLIEEDLGQSH